jgi:hypothetical protein
LEGLVQSKWLTGVFQSPDSPFKNSYQAYEKPESFTPENGFWLLGFLKSSFEIPACRKQDLANLENKPPSGIWAFSASHLLGFGHSQYVILLD